MHRPNGSARIRRLKKNQPHTLRRVIHRHFFLIFLSFLAYLSKLCATLFPRHATIDATDAMKNGAIGERPRAYVQVVDGSDGEIDYIPRVQCSIFLVSQLCKLREKLSWNRKGVGVALYFLKSSMTILKIMATFHITNNFII